eukprot:CAMPEP_0204311342 /NCGR_PEP_ID=MMETSP0469-20131031/2283_1 /ASSEMBLY_ACC=CAM_ASM_000384 /TAXON_ID=2969 /ORGANISM="Oxyrrhis marina" /LENGTH=115 /DNA_ID=CAMNT_0051291283 /DNA_START=52 /DNA_END=399 /DNA_ORIENTATION=+
MILTGGFGASICSSSSSTPHPRSSSSSPPANAKSSPPTRAFFKPRSFFGPFTSQSLPLLLRSCRRVSRSCNSCSTAAFAVSTNASFTHSSPGSPPFSTLPILPSIRMRRRWLTSQ